MTVEGHEAFSTRIVLYNIDKNVESDKPDMSVDVTMGGVRIIFLNLFVSRILNFLNEFQEAQTAVIEASQAAAQSAKENMQNVYAKATKLALNIDLKAPDIIIPENSTSFNSCLLDLGRICISNQFTTLDIKNEKNFSAVVDEMKLTLTDFKLSRVTVNNRNEIVKELTLLTPLTFKLTIKRNLSSSWYKAIPDIDIMGRIFSINLLLSQSDYKTIMSILNGNLAESEVSATPTPPVPVKPSEESNRQPMDSRPTMVMLDKHFEADKESKTSTFLRFNFTMDNLVVTLFTGDGSNVSIKFLHSFKI